MSKLEYEIKNLKGFVLGVGYLKDKILKEMEKNDYIEVDLLTNDSPFISKKNINAIPKKQKGKKVSIKKIKKIFKKKRPDYIICNIDDVLSYLRYFVKDSLYITNNTIYIYSDSKNINLDDIYKRYKRYIDSIDNKDGYIIINTLNYKNKALKNIKYFVVDTLNIIYDFIGNILTG